jgi:hypothetical protein
MFIDNICMHKTIFFMIVDDDPVVVDESIIFFIYIYIFIWKNYPFTTGATTTG